MTSADSSSDGGFIKLNSGVKTSSPYTVFTRTYNMTANNALSYRSSYASTFTVSGYGKDPVTTLANDSVFRIAVKVQYTLYNGLSSVETYYLNFRSGLSEWVMNSLTVTEDVTKGKISSLTLTLEYNGNGSAYFDNISVIENSERTTAYKYTQTGRPAAQYSGGIGTYILYDTENDPVAQISTDGVIALYDYDQHHRVTKALTLYGEPRLFAPIASVGLTSSVTAAYTGIPMYATSYAEYSYNTFGQTTEQVVFELSPDEPGDANAYGDIRFNGIVFGNVKIEYVTATDNSLTVNNSPPVFSADSIGVSKTNTEHLASSAIYKQDGNTVGAVITETSYLGTTRYFYDAYGRVIARIEPDNNGLMYRYDNLGNLELVYPVTYTTDAVIMNEANGEPDVENTAYASYSYYTDGILKEISTATTVYTFTYDAFGNTTNVKAGDNTLVSYTYNAGNGKLNMLTYGNGIREYYIYNELEQITEIKRDVIVGRELETVTDEYGYSIDVYVDVIEVRTLCIYDYNTDGSLSSMADEDGITVLVYDSRGRVVETVRTKGSNTVSAETRYKADGNPYFTASAVVYSGNSAYTNAVTNAISYRTDKLLSAVRIRDAVFNTLESFEYDGFDRLTEDELQISTDSDSAVEITAVKSYEYRADGKEQSPLVSYYSSSVNNGITEYRYTYDGAGNITEIRNGSNELLYGYKYDSLGQLIREDNSGLGKTYEWIYDNAGNILTKKTYNYTVLDDLSNVTPTSVINYAYQANSDRLISFGGATIIYDEIGNPTYYRGKELSWQGRTLTGYNSGEYVYSYNSEGLRTSKAYLYYQSGEEKYYSYTNYTLDGDRVIRVDGGDDSYRYIAYYYYDANGRPFMMKYHPTASQSYSYYFYETNLQGDVVAIYDANGAKVVSFTYDAWGNFTATVVNTTVCTNFFIEATLFRYRGYIYDYESGLYYLQSRYYDPETGRFINADEVSYLGVDGTPLSYNLYIYCSNNPIMGIDPLGKWTFSINIGFIGVIPFAGNGYYWGISLSVDSNEDFAIQTVRAVPHDDETELIAFGASGGLGVGVQYTSLESVDSLVEHRISTVGVNTPLLGENVLLDENVSPIGGELSIGASRGYDVHIMKSETTSLYKGRSLIKYIKEEWFGWRD